MPEPSTRLPWIDALRGLAIILMVPANLAPYFTEPHPMWFRILGSFAAPTFIMLSAGMVILTGERHNLAYFLKRGAIIIGTGVCIDLFLWDILPFTSFDVLYIIGLSLPLIYMLRNSSRAELLRLAIIVFLATYVLQMYFGYHTEALEVYLDEITLPSLGRLLQSFFIDGWFPLFPWIGYAVTGAVLFRTIFRENSGVSNRFLLLGATLTALGFLLLFVPLPFVRNLADGAILTTRGGYSEIFYPPTFAYIFTSIGIVLLFSTLIRRMPYMGITAVLAFFGRYSMLVYILHQLLGSLVVEPVVSSYGMEAIESGPWFTFVNLVVLSTIYALCFGVEMIKRKYPTRFTVLQVLFGK
ncbi:DUF1624 domain-containing protein [bacterium]|nr:DUF1624 domain-containing protein [bacterium]